MVTVKDTASFIHASRHQHGNRYDYSLSEWSGANGRIVITCRVCGPFEITADSHYRKGCGCRQCSLKSKARREGSYQICPYCRKWAKYRGASLACRECAKTGKARQKRRANYVQKMQRTCIKCGLQFTAKRQEQQVCRQSCKLPTVDVQCCVCGKQTERSVRDAKKRDAFCCSLECQRQLALVVNHSTRGRAGLPLVAVKCGQLGKFCEKCSRWKARLDSLALHARTQKPKSWRMQCNTMVACNRFRITTYSRGQSINKWKLWKTAFSSLSKERKTQCKWKQKFTNMASQHRKRMARKLLAHNLKISGTNKEESATTAVPL